MTQLKVLERDLQKTVVEMALLFGWAVHHTLDQKIYAKRIGPGFPDLTLAHPDKGRVVFMELKSEKGRLRTEQTWWAEVLSRCPGVEHYVFRPSDLDEIEQVLRR